jgi:ATP-dependent Zn protease
VTTRVDPELAVLRQNRKALEEGARLLLEKETLTREELPPLAEIKLAAASKVFL